MTTSHSHDRLQDRLTDAVLACDASAVRQALDDGARINDPLDRTHGWTALHIACRLLVIRTRCFNDPRRVHAVIETLIGAGADPWAEDGRRRTPMECAEGLTAPALRNLIAPQVEQRFAADFVEGGAPAGVPRFRDVPARRRLSSREVLEMRMRDALRSLDRQQALAA